MILLILPLLLTAAAATQLIDQFECGPANAPIFIKYGIQTSVNHCHYAVLDSTNLCCKAHDLCFDVHSLRGFTRQECDQRFCNCLQEASARNNNYECANYQHLFCAAAKEMGEKSYLEAKPNEHADLLAQFVDQRPWGLDMQSLVNACRYSRELAIHCHNSAVRCLKRPHERIRRMEEEESIVEHSYQDCRSTMHDCLESIILSEPSENCGAIARSIGKQINVYADLEEKKHGKSIIDTYSIIAARLIKQCGNSKPALDSCFSIFDVCAENNRSEHPKLNNAVRRIKIECHLQLRACIGTATSGETSEDCLEARALAIDRVRWLEMQPEKSATDAIAGILKDKAVGALNTVGDVAGKVVDGVATGVGAVADVVAAGAEKVKDWWGSWHISFP